VCAMHGIGREEYKYVSELAAAAGTKNNKI
jgi:hypothetical protein